MIISQERKVKSDYTTPIIRAIRAANLLVFVLSRKVQSSAFVTTQVFRKTN